MSTDHRNTSPSSDDGEESQSTPLKKKVGKKGSYGSSQKMTDKEQSEQFMQTARELGVDENSEYFDSALEKITSLPR